MAKNSAEENSIAIESAQENLPPKKFYRYRIGDCEVDDDGNYSGEKDLSRVKIIYSMLSAF